MRFSEVIGQRELKRHLVRGVDAGRVSHAQLFTGRPGAGALPLALAYVQYLNCTNRRDGDSCGECPNCRQIAGLAHPDLHFVFPVNKQGKKSGEAVLSDDFMPLWRQVVSERNGYFSPQEWYDRLDLGRTLKGAISAREADGIIRKLSFKSFAAEYKCVIVWLPETMNEEAANKILKILEEPWEKTLFVLVSERPDLLLPTILSRTQEVVVPRLTDEEVRAELERRGERDPEKIRTFTRLAAGDRSNWSICCAAKGTNSAKTISNFSVRHAVELQRQAPRTDGLGRRGGPTFAGAAAGFPDRCGASFAGELPAACGTGRNLLPVG